MSALRKYHIPLPGALLALLAFFLPWMSVGCQGLFSVDVSGFDLAANRLFNDAAGLLGAAADAPVDTTVFTILWLIPAAAVLSVALVLVTSESAQYWGLPGGKVAGVAQILKAKVAGGDTPGGTGTTEL